MPQAQTYQSEFTGLEMDARFTAVAQLTDALEALTTVVAQKYVKPASGIPSTDMDADVQAALAKANTAVQSLADYYTKSEVDQLLAAINGMDYVDVATLPTASASTLGKIYLVGPDGSGYYAYYYTSYDGSAYSWVGPLGTTQISLANYATKAELSQLDQVLNGETIPGEVIISVAGPNSAIQYVPNTCVEGDAYKYTVKNSAGSYVRFGFAKANTYTDWGVATSDGNILSLYVSSAVQTVTENITAPNATTYPYIAYRINSSGNTLELKKPDVVTDGLVQKVAKLETETADAFEVTSAIEDAKMQNIRWNKIFDTAGSVYEDNRAYITAKFPCSQNDTVVINAHGYTAGIVAVLRNSSGDKLNYWNLNEERNITVSYATAAYIECAFLKTGYGATISINGKTVFTYTQEMEKFLAAVYEDKFVFESDIEAISLKAVKAVKDNSIVFVHLTDTHSGYPDHMNLPWARMHMRMAMRLAERMNADFVVHTGDAIHGYAATAEPADVSYDALLAEVGKSSVPLIWAQGNSAHDFGYQNEMTRAQVNTIMGRFGKWLMQGAIYGDTRSYYYFDMSRTPCRVLVIDPDDGGEDRMSYGFSAAQISFIQTALAGALSAGLPVAMFAHMPLTGKLMPPYSIDGTAVEAAIKSYVDGGGKLLCYSFGHTHWDNYYYDKPNGIPYVNLVQEFPVSGSVSTQPDWGEAHRYTRYIGRLTEFAMDVYVIDVESGVARIFRYGCGNDRISNIADYSTGIGQTVMLSSELTATSWESLNEDIATVAAGVVSGVAAGDAEIIASDANGNQEFFKVTIS